MSENNGRQERLVSRSRISPETEAWLERRCEAFARATSGKGKPMSYGTGKEPPPKKKGAR
jgi:hypothetical protein